jgi:hypothetical protein
MDDELAPAAEAGFHSRLLTEDGLVDSSWRTNRSCGNRKTWRNHMLLATTTIKVDDFDHWLSVFSTKGAEKRRQYGSRGATVFRDPNEAGRLWVVFDWDLEGWQNFVSDPDVPAIMQEAGHLGKPQVAELAGQIDA